MTGARPAADIEAFVDQVRSVAAGGTAIDGEVMTEIARMERTEDPLTELTPRERDVLQILTKGYSNQQIARRLFISESTVSVHVSHIIAKLGVSNRLQAAAAAHRLNLFPSQEEGV